MTTLAQSVLRILLKRRNVHDANHDATRRLIHQWVAVAHGDSFFGSFFEATEHGELQ